MSLTLLGWLLRAQWREQPARMLLTTLAVAIGVSLGVSIHLVNRSALAEFGRAMAVVNGQAQAQLVATARSMDEDLYPLLANDPAVAAASPVIETEFALAATPKLPDASGPFGAPRLRVIGLDIFRAGAVTPSLLPRPDGESGTAFFAEDAIFLSSAALARFSLRIGDPLALRNGTEVVMLTVRGTVPGATAGQILAVMDLGALQWRFGWLGRLSRIDLRWRDGADAVQASQRWQAAIAAQASLVDPEASQQRASNLSRAYRVNLDVLALVALLTSGFIVHATLALVALRQRPLAALLQVLGARGRDTMAATLAQGAMLGGLGALLGLAGGIALATLMLKWFGADLGGGYFRGTSTTLVIEARSMIVFGALGLVTGMLAIASPAWSMRHVTLADAMRAVPSGAGRAWRDRWLRSAIGATFLLLGACMLVLPPIDDLPLAAYAGIACWLVAGIAWIPLVVRLLGRLVLVLERRLAPSASRWLGARSLTQTDATTRSALAGVVASFALATAMAIMVGSFRDSVQAWLEVVLPADVYLRSPEGASTGTLDATQQQQLAQVSGVARIDFLRSVPLQLDARRPPVWLIARPVSAARPASTLPLTGPLLAVPEGSTPVYVSEAMVDLYAMRPGSRVTLPIGPRGQEVFVAGVWRDYARQFGAVIIDLQAYRRASGDASVSDAAIWLSAGVTDETFLQQLRSALPWVAQADARSAQEIRQLSLTIFDRSFVLTYALQAIAIVIALVGVSAAFSAQALARAREFGMLRHLGMTRREVLQQLAWEATWLLLAGALWGLLIGAAVAIVLVFWVNPQSFHWTMSMHLPWAPLLGGAIALIGLGVLSAVIAGRSAFSQAPLRAVRQDW